MRKWTFLVLVVLVLYSSGSEDWSASVKVMSMRGFELR